MKGFAWTLSIGVLTTVFSASSSLDLLVLVVRTARPKTHRSRKGAPALKFWPVIKVTAGPHRWFGCTMFATLSILAIAGSLFLTLYPFKPPRQCRHRLQGRHGDAGSHGAKAINLLHEALQGMNLHETVQTAGAPGSAILRFEAPNGADISATVTHVQANLTKALGAVKFVSTDVVGPTVSSRRCSARVVGLGLAILAMLLYIWFRFEQFGLGAVTLLASS